MGLKNGFAFLDSVVIILIMGPWMVSIYWTGYINLCLLLIRWCWRNKKKIPYEKKNQMTQCYVKTTLMGLHKWKWKYIKTLWPLRAWLFHMWAFCSLYFSIYLPVFGPSPCHSQWNGNQSTAGEIKCNEVQILPFGSLWAVGGSGWRWVLTAGTEVYRILMVLICPQDFMNRGIWGLSKWLMLSKAYFWMKIIPTFD